MADVKQIVHLDLSGQQIWNAGFQTLPTDPGTPFIGQFYYNSASNKFLGWNGGPNWIDLGEMYSHPSYATTSIPGVPMTGAKVFSQITIENGHITNTVVRNLTATDIGAASLAHAHNFGEILGLPTQTILGNNTGVNGPAQALTVGDIMIMLGIAYGNATLLNTGTDTGQRTWSAKTLSDYITSRLGTYITTVNLALVTRTGTTLPITNSAGTGVTLPVATTTFAGLMSNLDKTKLDGITTGANNYNHPTDNPGTHPFISEITSGLQILSQITVNTQGHVTAIKGRDLTAADIAAVMIVAETNVTSTNQTWSAATIEAKLQATINQVTTGALVYQNNGYTPSPTQGTITPPTPQSGGSIKTGMVWVVSSSGYFGNQQVEAGDMIIAKVNNANNVEANYQIVNKNIPAILAATEFIEGIVYLASTVEAVAGTNTTKAVTPAGLKAALIAYTGGFYTTFGNTTSTSFTFAHGLGAGKLHIETRFTATNKRIIMEDYYDTVNVYLNMNVPPNTNEYIVTATKI